MSKIRTVPVCDVDGAVFLMLKGAVWDEVLPAEESENGNVISDITVSDLNWIEFDIPVRFYYKVYEGRYTLRQVN